MDKETLDTFELLSEKLEECFKKQADIDERIFKRIKNLEEQQLKLLEILAGK